MKTLGISTSCFGTRFTRLADQIEATRKLNFDFLEIGWSEVALNADQAEQTLADFGVKAPVMRAGFRETPRGPYRAPEWIASTQAESQTQAIQSILRDVQYATHTRSSVISISAGFVSVPGIDERIRSLISHLRQGSEKEANALREEIRVATEPHRLKHLDRLCRGIFELSKHAPEVTWAIETPKDPHFLPMPLELEHIFEDLPNVKIAYLHDLGKAALLQKLEGIPQGRWLENFVGRMSALRFHDILGFDLHQPPGLGEVDWKLVAGYIPKNAWKFLDVSALHGSEALQGGARFLGTLGVE